MYLNQNKYKIIIRDDKIHDIGRFISIIMLLKVGEVAVFILDEDRDR